MRTIDADLFKNNVKAWAENIRDVRSDNKCFFTEENILKAIDDQPTIEDVQIAINKQIPKKVYHFIDDDTFETSCCAIDVTNEDFKYCPECGQLLGEVEEIDEDEHDGE